MGGVVMLTEQRHAVILQALKQNGIVHTAALAEQMQVSFETVRKDLQYLGEKGLLTRVHGGAVPAGENTAGNAAGGMMGSIAMQAAEYIPFPERNSLHQAEKTAIAEKAVEFIREGESIALDYGSTSMHLAMSLARHFTSLTIVTNSVQNAMLLIKNPGFTVILTGGVLQHDEYSLVNDFTSILTSLHIDTFFLTVSGIDPVIGCTDQRLSEVTIQKQMRQAATRTVVLADSSKFGESSLIRICALSEVDAVISDPGVSREMQLKITDAGTRLILA